MKVYVVTEGEYSDYNIHSVWSTRERAQEVIDAEKQAIEDYDSSEGAGYYFGELNDQIEEYEVDDVEYLDALKARGSHVYRMLVEKDGTASDVEKFPRTRARSRGYEMFKDRSGKIRMSATCLARDIEHAQHIIGEYRQRALALGEFDNIPDNTDR